MKSTAIMTAVLATATLAAAQAKHGSIENWFTSLENPVMQADEFVIENRTVSVGGLHEE